MYVGSGQGGEVLDGGSRTKGEGKEGVWGGGERSGIELGIPPPFPSLYETLLF